MAKGFSLAHLEATIGKVNYKLIIYRFLFIYLDIKILFHEFIIFIEIFNFTIKKRKRIKKD